MSKKYAVGTIHPTKLSGDVEILEEINDIRRLVRFVNTGYTKEINVCNLSTQRIRDPYTPTVCGIGSVGEKYPLFDENGKKTREYALWVNMLNRITDTDNYPSYANCSVVPSWLYFPNFYEDIRKLEGYQTWLNPKNKYCLDKDIKQRGVINKVYGPATCKFVSIRDNVSETYYKGK